MLLECLVQKAKLASTVLPVKTEYKAVPDSGAYLDCRVLQVQEANQESRVLLAVPAVRERLAKKVHRAPSARPD